MPVYQYRCMKCDQDFERVESMESHDSSRVTCPFCGSEQVEQRFSSFFAKTSKKS